MQHLKLALLVPCLAALCAHGLARASDGPAVKADNPPTDKTMAALAQLVGGTWVNNNPNFVVENRWEWAFNNKVIRGQGLIGKGSAHETPIEALLGWDPVAKSVFYLDCHGGDQVFKGTVGLEGDKIVFEFATIVGKPASWREVLTFPDKDTMKFTIYGQKDGKWNPVVEQTAKRRRSKTDSGQLVTEGMIDAPVDAVWAAFTTKEGLESWNVAHAEIDMKIGGKMLTHYDAKGQIGDPNTIENIILSFEPKRMFSIQVGKPPEKFPYKDAVKKIWTVIRFDEAGPVRTKLTITGLGYGDDDDSRKLRGFFDAGNTYTIKKLQEKFAKGARLPGKPQAQSQSAEPTR
jgi:uncharacterized protein YndB with AHSA1/START domain